MFSGVIYRICSTYLQQLFTASFKSHVSASWLVHELTSPRLDGTRAGLSANCPITLVYTSDYKPSLKQTKRLTSQNFYKQSYTAHMQAQYNFQNERKSYFTTKNFNEQLKHERKQEKHRLKTWHTQKRSWPATECGKKYPLRIFLQFSQQSLGISKRNFSDIFSHPICT